MKKILSYFLVIAIICLSSCATVFHGTHQTVKVTSDPPGATVEVHGLVQGVTPLDLTLKKGFFKSETVVLKKEGYEDKSFDPTVRFDPVSLVNILFFAGFGVDLVTGAIMKYDPIEYTIPLTKKR